MPSLPNISSYSGGSAAVTATVTATETSTVTANVTATENHTVTATENHTVTATENHTVTATENHTVTATENHTVTATENHTVTATETSTVNQSVYAKNIDVVNCDADLVSTATLVIAGNTINIPSMLSDISTLQTKTQNITATSGATTNTGSLAVTTTLTVGGNSILATLSGQNTLTTSAVATVTGFTDQVTLRFQGLSTTGTPNPYLTLSHSTGTTSMTYLGSTSGSANATHAGTGIYLWDGLVAAASNYNGQVSFYNMQATGGNWYLVYSGQVSDGSRTVNICGRANWTYPTYSALNTITFNPGAAVSFDGGAWFTKYV